MRGRTSDGSHRGSSCPTVEIFEEMAGKARSLGDQIINEETALEMAFRGETIDETDLRSRSRIAALWGVSQFDGKNAGWRPANIHGDVTRSARCHSKMVTADEDELPALRERLTPGRPQFRRGIETRIPTSQLERV